MRKRFTGGRRSATSARMAIALLALGAACSLVVRDAQAADTTTTGKVQGQESKVFESKFVKGNLIVPPGVFEPKEAEFLVLPFIKENERLIKGKRVMEIGAGSGVNSIYMAQLGAEKVVATDISEIALQCVNENAKRLGVAARIETRLVPPSDMTAFSVLADAEQFDIILSNPPYALDLDADQNDALTDTGDLGISIIDGLEEHLAEGGRALLLYESLFYHHLIVKYARQRGWVVRHRIPFMNAPWETETLFNSYAARWARAKELDPNDYRFDYHEDRGLDLLIVKSKVKEEPLFPWSDTQKHIPGWIVVERP